MPLENVKRIIRQMMTRLPELRVGEVAAAAGVSRQSAHRHLREMVRGGELAVAGAGRGTRYVIRKPGWITRQFTREGLEEDRVWQAMSEPMPELAGLSGDAADAVQYSFMEIVNNAIDHSRSDRVQIGLQLSDGSLQVEVVDWGVGIFANVRERLSLASNLEALQEVSKGKTTTQADRHSGEGIFFVSKAVDVFEIDSGGLRWIVDNLRNDMAVGEAPERSGTLVRMKIDLHHPHNLARLFAEYTEEYRFTRTRTVVQLFQIGVRFLSRSEARRLLHGLEKFTEVLLDFQGVETVGQGFVDEIFRVWARQHPAIRLMPVNMCHPVDLMVRRGLATAQA